MPELPEVETVKNSIWKAVQGKQIRRVEVRHPDVVKNVAPEAFCAYLTGEFVSAMERRGKYLIFLLGNKKTMVCHLRMTGQLVAFEDVLPPINHCHLVVYFTEGGIYYRDVRRFGGFWVGENEAAFGCGIEKLGAEPLSEVFTAESFYAKVKGKHAPIKGLLLDQSVVAGIGNIYADEICFAAGVHPLTEGAALTLEDCDDLVKSTKAVLAAAIANRGTTFSDYRDGLGARGGFQDKLRVFQRGGMACPNCGAILRNTKCAGRGTTFCPCCQPLARGAWVIGLTGGIASGKTVASDYLASLGAEIIDADIIAREIMKPQGAVLKRIAAVFGVEYLQEDGSLNRRKMREDVFKDPEKVKTLNAITHPAIRRRIKALIKKAKAEIVVLVAPLLIEGKFYDLCDEVWLLRSEEKQQMRRLMRRDGINRATAENMMARQYSFEKKAKYAHCVIDNTGGKRILREALKKALEQRKALLYDEQNQKN